MDPNKLPKNSKPVSPTATAQGQNSTRVPKQPVVTGAKVVVPKETFGQKIRKTFINDNIADLKGYLVNNVIVPTVQTTVVSVLMNSIRMIFRSPGAGMGMGYGGFNPGWPPMSANPWGAMARPNTSINYGQYTRPGVSAMPQAQPTPSILKPTDIQIPTQDMAEKAVAQLTDIIQSYGRLTMLDFYETLGVRGNGFTDQNWGWTDLMGVEVKPHYAGGYMINMPPARALM